MTDQQNVENAVVVEKQENVEKTQVNGVVGEYVRRGIFLVATSEVEEEHKTYNEEALGRWTVKVKAGSDIRKNKNKRQKPHVNKWKGTPAKITHKKNN